MAQFLMIMLEGDSVGDWATYVNSLAEQGRLRGGSSLGNGIRLTKGNADQPCNATGFIRVEASSLEDARSLLRGNPLFEGGGVIELLEELQG